MLKRKFWNILIVDDEPDIHEVTSLVLKREKIYGSKLNLIHANSAQEAIDLLKDDPQLLRALSVALVDVVMETDHAGLDFCKHMREVFDKQATQLILRTGQPGQAPPRKIIDEYNISGYLTKLEASGDRLYMQIKQGVQAYYDHSVNELAQAWDTIRFRSGGDPMKMLEGVQGMFGQDFGPGQELHLVYDFFGRHYVGAGDFKERKAWEELKGDLLAKAKPELESRNWKALWAAKPGQEVPNPVARVDEYVVVQAKTLLKGEVATMVLKEPSYPRGMHGFYGALWRQPFVYFAEVLSQVD